MSDFEKNGNGGYRKPGRRFDSDRPRSYSEDRPQSRRPYRDGPRQDRPYRGDRDEQRFDRRDSRRSFDGEGRQDRPFRNDRGDRRFERREDGDRPRRNFEGDRPQREFRRFDGEQRSERPRFHDGERRSFDGDRPRRSFDGEGRQDRPFRNDRGDRRFERREDGDRPRRNFEGDRPQREFRRNFDGERPQREFRRFDGEQRSERPRFRDGERRFERSFDRPRRDAERPVRRENEEVNHAASENVVMEEMTDIRETVLEGRNPVWEALKAGRTMEKLMIANGIEEEGILPILSIARREKIKIERVPRSKLDEITTTGHHQGMIAMLPAMDYTPLETMIENAFAATEKPLFILLDELQDPHNLGAIIRTADCAGAQGVIILEHRSVGLTSTVAKVSAGALAHMPVAKVTNLARTIEILQQRGVLVVGADAEGESCYDVNMTGPTAIVIGNEGTGIRRLVKEQCDVLAGIPLNGHVDSLNASVAAAVLIFEAVRQRTMAVK